MKNSIEILVSFMEAANIKKISELETFDFKKIYTCSKLKEFDNNKGYEDGDCTKLAYAIDWIIWGRELQNENLLASEEDLFNEKNFSGDTIYTFNTLFGSTPDFQCSVISMLRKYIPLIKKEMEKFRNIYQTIGNFSLLPNKSINGQTLNKYRGRYWGWKDYFDIFLKELDKALNNESENSFFCDIVNENKFFFNKCNSVEKYCKLFYLDSNFSFKGNVHFNHNMLKDKNAEEYGNFVIDYIEKSERLIKKRASLLCKELIKILSKENDFPKNYLN